MNITHYRIRPEGGWLAAANVKLLSQWALGELGFTTLDRRPQSFDLLDGVNPPTNVVQGILQELYKVALAEPRTSAALYKYNYKYLLDEIDQNKDGYYSEQEYLQAVHLPSYRDHLYRLIAKHPSEWYYGKADELWTRYLDQLKKDVPEWKTYLETFIDRLAWMKQVPGIGPDPWHMHPVVFLSYLKGPSCDCEELYADKFKVTRYSAVYGPVYKGVITLKDYYRWGVLVSEGRVTIDEREIIVAMSENEGNMDTMQSYDSEVITAGVMQKTVKDTFNPNSNPIVDLRGRGELSAQLASFKEKHSDLYNQYALICGWTVKGNGATAIVYYGDKELTGGKKITGCELKELIRAGSNKETYGHAVHNKPLAALLKVISQPEYLDLQVIDFIDRLHSAESIRVDSNKRIKDFIKSRFGRAVVLEHSVNRPSYVGGDLKNAIEKYYINHPKVERDPAKWGADFEKNEIALLEEYKLTRRMTDSIARFNTLKAKL